MNVKTLPKGIFGAILAFVYKFFGQNYVLNNETGQFEMKIGGRDPISWQGYGEKYIATSTELGSLSAEFES